MCEGLMMMRIFLRGRRSEDRVLCKGGNDLPNVTRCNVPPPSSQGLQSSREEGTHFLFDLVSYKPFPLSDSHVLSSLHCVLGPCFAHLRRDFAICCWCKNNVETSVNVCSPGSHQKQVVNTYPVFAKVDHMSIIRRLIVISSCEYLSG